MYITCVKNPYFTGVLENEVSKSGKSGEVDSLIQCKMSLKLRVMLPIFYQIIYPFPTVLF